MTLHWQVRTLSGHSQSVRAVAFSSDGKQIGTGSQDDLVKIWDADTGAEVNNSLAVHRRKRSVPVPFQNQPDVWGHAL